MIAHVDPCLLVIFWRTHTAAAAESGCDIWKDVVFIICVGIGRRKTHRVRRRKFLLSPHPAPEIDGTEESMGATLTSVRESGSASFAEGEGDGEKKGEI